MSIAVEMDPRLETGETETHPGGPVYEMAQTVIEAQQAELEQLRERLSYYQVFDSLINDNIKRSAELFRTIYDEREKSRRQLAEARAEIDATTNAEVERRIASERQRTQAVLVSLMDEAGRMQRQLDGWVQRISDAITESAARPSDALNQDRPAIGG